MSQRVICKTMQVSKQFNQKTDMPLAGSDLWFAAVGGVKTYEAEQNAPGKCNRRPPEPMVKNAPLQIMPCLVLEQLQYRTCIENNITSYFTVFQTVL